MTWRAREGKGGEAIWECFVRRCSLDPHCTVSDVVHVRIIDCYQAVQTHSATSKPMPIESLDVDRQLTTKEEDGGLTTGTSPDR